MRLDKFLKITRIIKRRTIANELCDLGKIKVNDQVKKAMYSVKENDILEISYINKIFKVIIKKMPPETIKKEDILMYITVEEVK